VAALERRSPFSLVPPPLLYGATFLIGFFGQRRWFPLALQATSPAVHTTGFVLVGVGLLLALWSVGLFASERTTIVPHGTSSALIIRGPFRFTRNPMYVSLSCFYLGMAALMQAWLAAGLIVVPLLVISLVIIPMEEAQLRARFGDEYGQYRARVRRWL
jgi:protein-S-isoprenylcysteine O-methyltransferase Ste14